MHVWKIIINVSKKLIKLFNSESFKKLIKDGGIRFTVIMPWQGQEQKKWMILFSQMINSSNMQMQNSTHGSAYKSSIIKYKFSITFILAYAEHLILIPLSLQYLFLALGIDKKNPTLKKIHQIHFLESYTLIICDINLKEFPDILNFWVVVE